MGSIVNSLCMNPNSKGIAALKVLDEMSGMTIEVGFHEGQVADDGSTPLAAIAYWNHFGTVSEDGSVAIPARPFMDELEKKSDQLSAFCTSAVQNATDAADATRKIGAMSVGMIQKGITDEQWVPNAPSTIKKKGSDKPLIDTGRMRQEVHYVVKKGK